MTKEDRLTILKIEKQLYQIKSRYNEGLPITERVKTFEDALDIVEITQNQQDILEYNGQELQMRSTQAHLKLSIIAKALNEGWEPDWTDASQYKYYPWMKYTEGVGFSFNGCGSGHTTSRVGSRLCFKTRELAEYAGKQFQSIYNDFLN